MGQRNLSNGRGHLFWNDGWDGYSCARARLTGSLQKHMVSSPVVLGGDVHENWVGHLKADYANAASAAIGVEFCGTSVTSRSGGDGKTSQRLAQNPHFVFSQARSKGYGVVEFGPTQLCTTLRVLDDVSRQDSGIQTLARFVVRRGESVVEPI